jgi:alpha-glucosidase
MQWADAPNAGFSPPGVEPWLPVNPNYAQGVNVADQEHDPGAILQFYRRLLAVRRATPALLAGEYAALHPEAEEALLFTRATPEQTVLVGLNFSEQAQSIVLEPDLRARRVLFSSAGRPVGDDGGDLVLAPFEVYIAAVMGSGTGSQ